MRGLRLLLLLVSMAVSLPVEAAIDILVLSPRPSQPALGEVEVSVRVLSSEPIVELEIWVDGELEGRFSEPPYRLVVDVGFENREHVFEIRARDARGEEGVRRVVSEKQNFDLEVELDLQQLYVTVTRGGRRVLDLGREAFEIVDNGEPQQIVTFERGDVPLTAALLLDASFSMRGEYLEAALLAARTFLESMRDYDQARVVLFSDTTLAATPFSDDPAILGSVMDAAEAAAGTALNDQLFMALKQLEARQGRRIIVLLSDGVDVESALDIEDVLWKAGRLPALVYWIRPNAEAVTRLSYYSLWRNPEAHREEIDGLERLVRQSGGQIRDIELIEDAPQAFREIVEELREQYVLGYYPTSDQDDGAWHEVKVRVRGGQPRALKGYYDAP